LSRILNITCPFNEDIKTRKELEGFKDFKILSRSLDARGAPRGKVPRFNYRIELEGTESPEEVLPRIGALPKNPIIVGMGPCGLFTALTLLDYGIPSTLIEQGEPLEHRMVKMARYFKYGELDEKTNVCFGEGGAGLFSDGKLNTRIKSPLIKDLLNKLVQFGAPEDILIDNYPHVGSDRLRKVIRNIVDYLKAKGCQIHYNTELLDFYVSEGRIAGIKTQRGEIWETDHLVLATGHSARSTYRLLKDKNIAMEAKDFAVGVRIEHPRAYMDKLQLGRYAGDPRLGSARYSLSHHNKKTDRGCYSFCMCPGGLLVPSASHQGELVTNGMSNLSRNLDWSNSALIVTVKAGQDFKSDILAGMHFQGEIEKKAFRLSKEESDGHHHPALSVFEFLEDRIDRGRKLPKTSPLIKTFKSDFKFFLPPFVISALREGLLKFNEHMNGFLHKDAMLVGPETRTSAPLRILRDFETLVSPSISGFYPGGEGAGHAGGITSAGVDGMKIAHQLAKTL